MQPRHQFLTPTWGKAHGIALQRALTGSSSQSGHSWACPSTMSRRWTSCASRHGEGASGDAEQFVPIGCGPLLVRCAPRQPPASNQYMTRSVGQAAVHGSQTIPQRASCQGGRASIKQEARHQVTQQRLRPRAASTLRGHRGDNMWQSTTSDHVLGWGASRQPSLERDQPPPSSSAAQEANGPSDRRSPPGLAGDPPCPAAATARATGSSRATAALTVSSAVPPRVPAEQNLLVALAAWRAGQTGTRAKAGTLERVD
jgi:hypothetical protein